MNDPDNAWRLYAACRGRDPELFAPAGNERRAGALAARVARAARICLSCPVQHRCLTEGLACEGCQNLSRGRKGRTTCLRGRTGDCGEWGIWGGELLQKGRVRPVDDLQKAEATG